MKQWLELNITINGFTYAVREELEDISDIESIGIELSKRLYNIVKDRESNEL